MSIRKRGKQAYQVRVPGFPARTVPTLRAAKELDLQLKLRRSMGELHVEKATTLGDEIDAVLNRVRASSLSPTTIQFYERSARIWEPFRPKQVSSLRRPEVQDLIVARAALHGRSAAVIAIPAIKHQPRRGSALTVSELYDLASWFPEHSQRLVLVAGQVGARQKFWFNLTGDLLDLRAGTLTVPAELAKNGREHRVYLTPVETQLLREQLLARAPGTRLVFPTPTGLQWTRSGFRERLWLPAVKLAATRNDRLLNFTSIYSGTQLAR